VRKLLGRKRKKFSPKASARAEVEVSGRSKGKDAVGSKSRAKDLGREGGRPSRARGEEGKTGTGPWKATRR